MITLPITLIIPFPGNVRNSMGYHHCTNGAITTGNAVKMSTEHVVKLKIIEIKIKANVIWFYINIQIRVYRTYVL